MLQNMTGVVDKVKCEVIDGPGELIANTNENTASLVPVQLQTSNSGVIPQCDTKLVI
jgi:hypothetical protein